MCNAAVVYLLLDSLPLAARPSYPGVKPSGPSIAWITTRSPYCQISHYTPSIATLEIFISIQLIFNSLFVILHEEEIVELVHSTLWRKVDGFDLLCKKMKNGFWCINTPLDSTYINNTTLDIIYLGEYTVYLLYKVGCQCVCLSVCLFVGNFDKLSHFQLQ